MQRLPILRPLPSYESHSKSGMKIDREAKRKLVAKEPARFVLRFGPIFGDLFSVRGSGARIGLPTGLLQRICQQQVIKVAWSNCSIARKEVDRGGEVGLAIGEQPQSHQRVRVIRVKLQCLSVGL